MKKHKAGIYCIRNKINGKMYIGQALNPEKRMKQKHHNSWALLSAFDKYGKDNFECKVLRYFSEELLDKKEQYYIKKLKTLVPNGYNISRGGSHPMMGRTHSDITKKKMKNSHKDVLGINNPMFGKHYGKKKSKYLGVYSLRQKVKSKWVARITFNRKHVYIGISDSEEECAVLYDNYVIKNDLPCKLNFEKE